MILYTFLVEFHAALVNHNIFFLNTIVVYIFYAWPLLVLGGVLFARDHIYTYLRSYMVILLWLWLVIMRTYWVTDLYFAFFFLNALLVCIPLWTVQCMKIKNSIVFMIALAITILFYPNTIYLVTDLKHLHHVSGLPLWYDIFLLGAFAVGWSIMSAQIMQCLITQCKRYISWYEVYTILLFFVTSVWVYIGRFLRFHSVDIIRKPLTIIYTTRQEAHTETFWIYIGLMTILLYITYKGYMQKIQ